MPNKKNVQDWRVYLIVGILVVAVGLSASALYVSSRVKAPAPISVSPFAAVSNFGVTSNDLMQQLAQTGKMWDQSYYTPSIASSGVITFLVVTDPTTVTTPYISHILFRPTATDTLLVRLYAVAPITSSNFGVTQTLVNYNRVYSAVMPRAHVYFGPTITPAMTTLLTSILVPENAILPSQEWVLSASAKYAVEVTNISPDTVDIGWRMALYESQ